MKAKVSWQGEASFEGLSASGHTITMDGAPEYGGQDKGARPMELLLLGMGGCTAFDVVFILKKFRESVTGCEVDLEATRADSEPKVFTDIHCHFRVSGHDLNREKVERAISLSAEKYCSASIMLGKTARITHDFEILAED